jgi:hypothetical protein
LEIAAPESWHGICITKERGTRMGSNGEEKCLIGSHQLSTTRFYENARNFIASQLAFAFSQSKTRSDSSSP